MKWTRAKRDERRGETGFREESPGSGGLLGASKFLAVSLMFLAGCVHTSTIELGHYEPYAPIDPYDVQVFLYEEDVPGEFEKLAVIFAEGDGGLHDEHDLVYAMKEEAAYLGANGIILSYVDKEYRGGFFGWLTGFGGHGHGHRGGYYHEGSERRGEVIAIRYYYNDAGRR